jgi:hypothetical protein
MIELTSGPSRQKKAPDVSIRRGPAVIVRYGQGCRETFCGGSAIRQGLDSSSTSSATGRPLPADLADEGPALRADSAAGA